MTYGDSHGINQDVDGGTGVHGSDRDREVISLEQLSMGQRVEVLAGCFEEEPQEVFVMAITVKD